jgi:hypothetical protein
MGLVRRRHAGIHRAATSERSPRVPCCSRTVRGVAAASRSARAASAGHAPRRCRPSRYSLWMRTALPAAYTRVASSSRCRLLRRSKSAPNAADSVAYCGAGRTSLGSMADATTELLAAAMAGWPGTSCRAPCGSSADSRCCGGVNAPARYRSLLCGTAAVNSDMRLRFHGRPKSGCRLRSISAQHQSE